MQAIWDGHVFEWYDDLIPGRTDIHVLEEVTTPMAKYFVVKKNIAHTIGLQKVHGRMMWDDGTYYQNSGGIPEVCYI